MVEDAQTQETRIDVTQPLKIPGLYGLDEFWDELSREQKLRLMAKVTVRDENNNQVEMTRLESALMEYRRTQSGAQQAANNQTIRKETGDCSDVVCICPEGHHSGDARLIAVRDPRNPANLIIREFERGHKPKSYEAKLRNAQAFYEDFASHPADLDAFYPRTPVGHPEERSDVNRRAERKRLEADYADQKRAQSMFRSEMERVYSEIHVIVGMAKEGDKGLDLLVEDVLQGVLEGKGPKELDTMRSILTDPKNQENMPDPAIRSLLEQMLDKCKKIKENSLVPETAVAEIMQQLPEKEARAAVAVDRIQAATREAISGPEKPSIPETKYNLDEPGRVAEIPEPTSQKVRQPLDIQTGASKASQRLSPEIKATAKAALGLGEHAVAGILGDMAGEYLKDRGPVPESQGGALLEQRDNDLTMAKQKAFANLGAAGMATAATGIALTAGGKFVARVAGKKAVEVGAKAVPVVGTVIGLGMAANRTVHGDFSGAGMEVLGVAVDFIPGYGQVASLGIDASLAARDVMMKDGVCAFGAVDSQGNPIMIKDANGESMQAVGSEISYKNNVKDGMAKWYAFNDKGEPYVALVGSYKDDRETGEWVRLNEKGEVLSLLHFDNGRPCGDILHLDNRRNVIAQGNLTKGTYVEYHTDADGYATSQVKQSGPMTDGVPSGVWQSYEADGKKRAEVDYDTKRYREYDTSAPNGEGEQPKIKSEGTIYPGGRIIGSSPQSKETEPREFAPTYTSVGSTSRNAPVASSVSVDAVSKPISSIGVEDPSASSKVFQFLCEASSAAQDNSDKKQTPAASNLVQQIQIDDGGR